MARPLTGRGPGLAAAGRWLAGSADTAVAALVVTIVVMMVVPVPPPLLDVLIAANLTFSLVVLLMTMYTQEPLEIAVFPSLLLLATLFRLALNVSSTRLILLQGDAGAIIHQFGHFVVGGDLVVGLVVFFILVVIQFVVITRGAERVAEVAARFTLDALPGKQMSIDADLSAGLIDEQEARARRQRIAREADFYGAMDGASKFVKGDAIAGVIITVVNLVGGVLIGTLRDGRPLAEAVQAYSLLTVGDGLVSQIPALLLATATGIVVTRAASDEHLGSDLRQQVFSNPRVLRIAAAFLAVLALVPGLPKLPFLVLAGIALAGARGLQERERRRQAEEAARAREAEQAARAEPEPVAAVPVDPIEIELGYGLLGLADEARGGDLLARIAAIRRQLAQDLGVVVPLVRVRDNMLLDSHTYVIRLRGAEAGRGQLMPDHYLAMATGLETEPVEGIETVEPAFGLPALWVPAAQRERAELAGYTVVDPASVLATHLSELLRRNAYRLLTRQDTRQLLDTVRETAPALVEELLQHLSLGEIQKVLQNLLREGVPIRDLITIGEALADHAPATRDVDLLTEYVRHQLAAQISERLPVRDGKLQVLAIDPAVEQVIRDSLQQGPGGSHAAVPADWLGRLLRAAQAEVRRIAAQGIEPVVLCAPVIRLHLFRLLEAAVPHLTVVSYNELVPHLQVETVGVIRA